MKRFIKHSVLSLLVAFIGMSTAFADLDEGKIHKELPMLLGSTNQGTEFVMTFHPCWEEVGENNELKIYVASAEPATVTLEIPAKQIFEQKVTVPREVTEFGLSPTTGQMYAKDDSQEPQPQKVYKGMACIVKSTAPIVCYGVTRYRYTSDGYLAIPVSGLGTEYIVSAWNDPTMDNGNQYLTSYTSIVAAYDRTRVEFTLGGERSNYTPGNGRIETGDREVNKMNKGDVWLIGVNGDYNDVSGSFVKADKPVAVISGSFCAYVPAQVSACDFIIEQDLPMHTWGTKYHATVITDREKGSFVRMYVSEPNTYIYRDGDPFSKVTTVGGELGTGYVSMRVTQDPIPVTLSADSRFSVTQYNTGQSDDGVSSDPFQMVLTPLEQYQKEIIFCTPGVHGGYPFKRNYLNLCYKSTKDGFIPDDMEIGIGRYGNMSWQKLNSVVTNPGLAFYDPEITDGRNWKSVTISLDDPAAVYALRGETKFSAYGYGFADYDSYGWPVAVALADLSKPDIWSPTVEYTQDCFGQCYGTAVEEPEEVDSLRSNFMTVRMLESKSYNYKFKMINEDDFFPGETRYVDWEIMVEDPLNDAKAHLLFTDRAGNETDTIIEYKRTKFRMTPIIALWPQAAYNDPPSVKTLSITNESDVPVMVDSLILLSKDADRVWEENGFSIDQSIYTEGILPKLMQPDEKLSFDVYFDPAAVKDEILSGKSNFIDSVGIKAYWSDDVNDYCYYRYQSAVKAGTGTPYIRIERIDFGEETVNHTSDEQMEVIFNEGSSPLSIYGVELPPEVDAEIFKVVRLEPETGDIDLVDMTADTVVIPAGESIRIGVRFTPEDEIDYAASIKFISDADTTFDGHDPVLELTGKGIAPGIAATGSRWGERRAHLPIYEGHPYFDASVFPYELDINDTPGRLTVENTGTQVFTIFDVSLKEPNDPDAEFFTVTNPENGRTFGMLDGVKQLLEGLEMDTVAPGNFYTLPVSYDPTAEGNHEITLVITGEMHGYEVSAECTFSGSAFAPQAITENYNFTEFAVEKAQAAGFNPNQLPPEGIAIIGDTETPYYEYTISLKAEDWSEFAHPVNIYAVQYDQTVISDDINTPGTSGFAVNSNELQAILNNPVAPGDSVYFTARYYPIANDDQDPTDGYDFAERFTFVTDARITEHYSDWTAKSIDQGAITGSNSLSSCIQYQEYRPITITNTANDELVVDSLEWTDDYAAYKNDGQERFTVSSMTVDGNDVTFPVTLPPLTGNTEEARTLEVMMEFEQMYPDDNGQPIEQVFEFVTNIAESNSEVTLPLEATITTLVTSYPRETYSTINKKDVEEFEVTFADGGTKFDFAANIGPYPDDMTLITKQTDFEVTVIYDANFLGTEMLFNEDGSFTDAVKLGDGLDPDDYRIASITAKDNLTENDLVALSAKYPEMIVNVTNYITALENPEKLELRQITIGLENYSGQPITTQEDAELVKFQMRVVLNNNLFEVVGMQDERRSELFHGVWTNEPCLGLDWVSDPTLYLENVCAENLRLVDIPTSSGQSINFDLDDINPNPVGSEGTDIKYSIGFDCNTIISIYNEAGELVATPVSGSQKIGNHTVAVPIDKLSSGVYFVRMNAGPYSETVRMNVTK